MKKLQNSKRPDRASIDLTQVRALLNLSGRYRALDGQEKVYSKAFARLEHKWWTQIWPTFGTKHPSSRRVFECIWNEMSEVEQRLQVIQRLRSRLAPLPGRRRPPPDDIGNADGSSAVDESRKVNMGSPSGPLKKPVVIHEAPLTAQSKK